MSSPNVYIFNPTCDMAVQNGSVSYMAPERLRHFEDNLAAVTMWLANDSDYVVIQTKPDAGFVDVLARCNVSLPNFITLEALKSRGGPLGDLRPWGWSPEVHHRVRDLKPHCGQTFANSPNKDWRPAHRLFFSRATNQQLINELLPLTANSRWLEIPNLPILADNSDAVYRAIDGLNGKAVLKTPWSSSGRGIMMVDGPQGRLADDRWVTGAIKQQGCLVVEPLLNKLIDLSFHFWVSSDGSTTYLGHNFFMTDEKGKFQGCYIEPYPNVSEVGTALPMFGAVIDEAAQALQKCIAQLNIGHYYEGPVGVDALWFINNNDELRLYPAVEINLRYTMGLVNIKLREKLGPNIAGKWQIAQFAPPQWDAFCRHETLKHPLVIENGLVTSGFLPLTPSAGIFGAFAYLGNWQV